MSNTAEAAAQRQFLASIKGIEGFWATVTGDEVTSEATRAVDGGNLKPDVLTSPGQPGDMTCSRLYRPARDRELLRKLRAVAGRWRTSITVQDTDPDLIPVGKPTVHTGKLLRVTGPERDQGSGEAARISLVFAIESVA